MVNLILGICMYGYSTLQDLWVPPDMTLYFPCRNRGKVPFGCTGIQSGPQGNFIGHSIHLLGILN